VYTEEWGRPVIGGKAGVAQWRRLGPRRELGMGRFVIEPAQFSVLSFFLLCSVLFHNYLNPNLNLNMSFSFGSIIQIQTLLQE
jgi:hypothetical protein